MWYCSVCCTWFAHSMQHFHPASYTQQDPRVDGLQRRVEELAALVGRLKATFNSFEVGERELSMAETCLYTDAHPDEVAQHLRHQTGTFAGAGKRRMPVNPEPRHGDEPKVERGDCPIR